MNIPTPENNQYFDLTRLGLLKISGAGAAKLLQGQLTCDIQQLKDKQGLLCAHCSPQGRVISLFYIFHINQDYYLLMPPTLISIALTALKKYAPFYQAILTEATGAFYILGTQNNTTPFDAAASYTFPDSSRNIYLLETAPVKSLAPYEDWHYLDLREGIPVIYPETSGLFLPHDLNLPQLEAVCFEKGCFTGQEIIARMHYRGKPKNHLYRGTATLALAPGTELLAGTNVAGTVIDCSQHVYNEHYPLLFVANEVSVATETLQTRQGNIIEMQKSE